MVFFCDGFVYDSLRYKVNFLKLFIFEVGFGGEGIRVEGGVEGLYLCLYWFCL